MKPGVADAAQLGLGRKRYHDAAGKLLAGGRPLLIESDVLGIEFKIPGAVEVLPLGALKLGLRIFRPGYRFAE
jgi:hypothetical protein